MPCLPPDDPVLARLRHGRRRGELTLRELGAAVALLRASGHRPRRIARAAGMGCAALAALERETRCPAVSLHDLCHGDDACACPR
jgi:hypothetical protein